MHYDIEIMGKTFQQYLGNLQLVFDKLRQAGLRKKTHQMFYLGHRISRKGVATDPVKADIVMKWSVANLIQSCKVYILMILLVWQNLCIVSRRGDESLSGQVNVQQHLMS